MAQKTMVIIIDERNFNFVIFINWLLIHKSVFLFSE